MSHSTTARLGHQISRLKQLKQPDLDFDLGENLRHFSPNPTASGSKKGLDLRREGGNCPLQRLRPSVGRSERASLTIDCPRLTPKS